MNPSILKAPRTFIRRLYDWTIRWSKSKRSSYALFLIAFAESSFFPIPPDVLLIPMVVGNRTRWFKNALICTIGSVTGAILGYLIGWMLFESVGRMIVDFYHLHDAMNTIHRAYSQNAFIAILLAGFTVIPFKVFTISAGLFQINLAVLVLASGIGRSSRFFLVAGLLRIFGERIANAIEKYFDLLSAIFLILLVGGFFAVKYLLKSP